MAEITPPVADRMNTSSGHLSVYVEGAHATEVRFLFERQPRRLGISVLVSFAIDVGIIALMVFLGRLPVAKTRFSLLQDQLSNQIVWLNEPGPGGGGGGGGNKMEEPPRKVELPGRDKITVPVKKPAGARTAEGTEARARPGPTAEHSRADHGR